MKSGLKLLYCAIAPVMIRFRYVIVLFLDCFPIYELQLMLDTAIIYAFCIILLMIR